MGVIGCIIGCASCNMYESLSEEAGVVCPYESVHIDMFIQAA